MVGCCFNPLAPLRDHTLPHFPRPRLTARARRAGLLLPLLVAIPGCRDAFAGFGAGAKARAGADQLFGALGERHADVARNAKYDYARIQITRGALTPSHVFRDSAAWTGISGPVRLLETRGGFADGRYLLASHANAPAPRLPADGRHIITLSQLADNEFRWDATVDFAVGSARPSELASVLARLMGSAERSSEGAARADLLAAAPRTSTVLGAAFSLDSIHPVPLADGTTALTLVIRMRSDLLARRYPAFGDYMRKYVDPARYRLVVSDRAGAAFMEAVAEEKVLTIRVRTRRGELMPLAGAARAMPDTLVLAADFKARIKHLGVGFHGLTMQLIHHREGDEANEWVVTARREPEWDLPLASARLIRAPLRRPFAGEGSLFRLGLRASPAGPTTIVRQSRLFVQESAILRFINSLGSTAMNDFEDKVEREENAWLRELFVAMRDDARAAITP